jgi:hypothetical protein
MSDKHWKAVADVPKTISYDWMSIVYYTGISWADTMVKDMLRTGGYSPFAYYLADGVRDTIKQDYLINLTGMGSDLESEGTSFFY